jgi:NLI interacting factor-like phosphatase
VINGLDLKQALVVDNQPKNFVNYLECGIPIIPFLAGPHQDADSELVNLKEYLELLLANRKFMTKINLEYFGLKKAMLVNRNHLMLRTKTSR